MRDIGVRELKDHASETIRRVLDRRMRYMIARRGKPKERGCDHYSPSIPDPG